MITNQKKRAMNPMLFKVLMVSAALHVLAGLIFGGITIARYVIPDESQFEEAPESPDTPPPEVKVQIKPETKPKIEPLKNFRTQKIGNIAVSDINVDLPSSEDSFTVSAGIGGFGVGGNLLGSSKGRLDFGSSNLNVFGIKAKAERVLFVLDTSREMLLDTKGGFRSYRIIKEEITQMIGNLSAGTLFNVMLNDHQKTILFKPQLVSSGTDSHQELIQWLAPINRNSNKTGLDYTPGAEKPTLRALPNDSVQNAIPERDLIGNDTAFITQYALEQGVDTIFVIAATHRGFERLPRPLNAKEEAAWNFKINSPEYKAQLAKHELEIPRMEQRIQRKLSQLNAERAKKGQPPRVLNRRYGIYSAQREVGLEWETEHPGFKPWPFYDPRELTNYFKRLLDELYIKFNKPIPSINVILFLGKDEDYSKDSERRLKEFVRFFNGKERIIRGGQEIKKASSSSTVSN